MIFRQKTKGFESWILFMSCRIRTSSALEMGGKGVPGAPCPGIALFGNSDTLSTLEQVKAVPGLSANGELSCGWYPLSRSLTVSQI